VASAASGSWENNHVAGEHIGVAKWFLSNVIKWETFFEVFASYMRILNA
jgi:hypothetical protein